MKTDSDKQGMIKPLGFETEINCPLRVIDIDLPLQVRVYSTPKPSLLGRIWRHAWPWVCFVACCVLSYFIVSHFIVTTVVVQGRSMSPTLIDGDRYLLHRWQLLFKEPQRGDLVVIRDAIRKDFVVKRVVALPGERLHFRDGSVWIDGKKLNEPYLPAGTRTGLAGGVEALVVVGLDRYFVMGDNRDLSEDSRAYGAVLREQILGFIPQ